MTTPKPREFFSDEGVDLITRGIFPDEMDRAAQSLAICLKAERARNAKLVEALRGIIEIGKRDMSNPKYDGYFESAKEALAEHGGES